MTCTRPVPFKIIFDCQNAMPGAKLMPTRFLDPRRQAAL